MTKVSNDYLKAHGYPAENHERKITTLSWCSYWRWTGTNGVNNKAYTHKSNNGQTNAGPPPVTAPTQCGNCGMRNHNTNEFRKPRAGHGNTDHVVCFNVIRWGTNEMHAQLTDRTDRLDHSGLRQCNISQHIRQHIITMIHITVTNPAVTGKLRWHVDA